MMQAETDAPNQHQTMNLSLGEVQRFVSDLSAARAFYKDTLGLKLTAESKDYLIFDISGVEFIIMAGATPGQTKQAYGKECTTVLCLKSTDIFGDYEELQRRGVSFFSAINEVAPGKYYVAFQDSEGNLLELIQK